MVSCISITNEIGTEFDVVYVCRFKMDWFKKERRFQLYEFKKQGLGASQTYLNARNKLIEVGLIKITYEGGMAKGDMNKYKLLWIDGDKHLEMRWKRYPDENWKHEVPCKKDNMVGIGTRFKKSISTLKNKTLNDTISPNELDPMKMISPND